MTEAKVTGVLIVILVIVLPAFSQSLDGVSPGEAERISEIEGRCPTFIWDAAPGAAFHELVAYRLPEDSDLVDPWAIDLADKSQVLYAEVPGSTPAWRPELAECLTPGGNYVWFVRAVYREEGGEVVEASEWSDGRYFSLSAAPSAEEVEQALGVLSRYLEQDGGGTEELGALPSDPREPPASAAPTARAAPGKLGWETLPGSAAIKGEMPDLTGETYGVYGVTNSGTEGSIGVAGEATAATGEVYGIGGLTTSAEGAGVIAFNTSNGTDLILGADSNSAHLTELGLTRSMPGAATFDVSNPDGAGTMTLRVDGVDVVTTATDQDSLGGLSCANGELAKWNGSQWVCAPDDGNHAATHQNGGADELDVTGLSGVLAEAQTPASHAITAHTGTLNHSALGSISATDHHSNANDPTAAQKAALAGEGTPSATNKYTTKSYVDGRPHTNVVSGTKPHTDTSYTAGTGYSVAITVDTGYTLTDALATGYQTNLGGNPTGLLTVETNVNGSNLELRVYDSGGNEPDGGGWPPSTRVRIDYLAIVTK